MAQLLGALGALLEKPGSTPHPPTRKLTAVSNSRGSGALTQTYMQVNIKNILKKYQLGGHCFSPLSERN